MIASVELFIGSPRPLRPTILESHNVSFEGKGGTGSYKTRAWGRSLKRANDKLGVNRSVMRPLGKERDKVRPRKQAINIPLTSLQRRRKTVDYRIHGYSEILLPC